MYKIYKHTLKEGFDHSGWSYIGLTKQPIEKRWQNGFGYKNSLVFKKAITKYGWDNFTHEILEDEISTLEEANKREQYWIAYYHTWIKDPLRAGYNITLGGDGTPGHKLSEVARKKISQQHTGKKLSERHKAHISATLKANNHNFSLYAREQSRLAKLGKPRSAETKEKLRLANTGKHVKPVKCLELNKIFSSIKEASQVTNIARCNIGAVCNGKRGSAGGYHWVWVY